MAQRCQIPVLWIDLRSSERSTTLLELFKAAFQIENLDPHNPVFDHRTLSPCAICFDFDYPDMHGLMLMRELHERYPRLPIIMMTEQHSESLMVWALRVRVWDIFLKPMTRSAAEYQIGALSNCIEEAAHDPTALSAVSPMLRLPEESRFNATNAAETRAVHPALSYMQLHLGEHITEERLAQFCNMRPLQFSRMFKKAYDVTFQEMLQQLRVKEATRLLENPDLQILDVALTVGYRDHSYFCRVFKKYLGVTPKTSQE
ncbi:MAG: helix-turn-helix domain-containing protein [Oceanospirillales bacterium]|nr:helix-turn-helix domain-containing protein [Oceanospirillales bacterium]